jgi:hypothetical protein
MKNRFIGAHTAPELRNVLIIITFHSTHFVKDLLIFPPENPIPTGSTESIVVFRMTFPMN